MWESGSHTSLAAPVGVHWVEVACNERGAIARRSDGEVEVLGSTSGFLVEPEPMRPGRSYVQVASGHLTHAAVVGATSTYVTFGDGCGGSLPPSQLVPFDTPQVGKVFEVSVTNLPVDVAFVGYSQTALPTPFPLQALGMPGCFAHIAYQGLIAVAGSGGRAQWSWSVPDVASLIGQGFVNQAVVLDPGSNTGVVVSAAARGVIGGTRN